MATRNAGGTATEKARATRAQTAALKRIVQLLKEDHQRAKKAFKDFEKLDVQDDPETAQALVEQTCAELEVHAELEEQLFYPAARETVKKEDVLDEAEVEHMTFKMLLEQLRGLQVEDERYAATFKVLGEYVQHHVKEEEGEMFKQLGNQADWASVLEQMLSRREELLEEKGLAMDEALAPVEEKAQAAARKAPARRSASSERGGKQERARPQASADESDDEE